MAGGHMKYRTLSRTSAHRQSLLRNLVTSLITHESIRTTWHKAKEAQRLAEKLITMGKKNTNASRTRAQQILFTPMQRNLKKVFGELASRYSERPGGYTRVLRMEPLNKHHDQAPSAILELVDGPRDMRFAMTAKSLLRERAAATATTTTSNKSTGAATDREEAVDMGIRDITAKNVLKVTRYRAGGETDLQKEVERLEAAERASGKRDDDAGDADELEVERPTEETRRPDWRRYDAFDAQERKKRRTVHKIKTIRQKDKERKRLRD